MSTDFALLPSSPHPLLPGYSNWKLTSLYLYSYREIRRLHKFFCVDLHLFIAFYSALFSEKTICWGWVNDAPLSCRGWSDKCILLKSAYYLSWTNKYPALSIGTAHGPCYPQLNLFTMLHWHYDLSCLNQMLEKSTFCKFSLTTVRQKCSQCTVMGHSHYIPAVSNMERLVTYQTYRSSF